MTAASVAAPGTPRASGATATMLHLRTIASGVLAAFLMLAEVAAEPAPTIDLSGAATSLGGSWSVGKAEPNAVAFLCALDRCGFEAVVLLASLEIDSPIRTDFVKDPRRELAGFKRGLESKMSSCAFLTYRVASSTATRAILEAEGDCGEKRAAMWTNVDSDDPNSYMALAIAPTEAAAASIRVRVTAWLVEAIDSSRKAR